jgi:hypothetical protein
MLLLLLLLLVRRQQRQQQVLQLVWEPIYRRLCCVSSCQTRKP